MTRQVALDLLQSIAILFILISQGAHYWRHFTDGQDVD